MCLFRYLKKKELKLLGRSRSFKAVVKVVQKVSKRDIVVFKGFKKSNFSRTLRSPYQGTTLPEDGVLETQKFTGRVGEYIDRVEIYKGIHGGLTRPVAGDHGNTTRQMVIPKDTPYVIGHGNEVVALKMVLKSKWDARPKRKNTKPSKRKLVKKRT